MLSILIPVYNYDCAELVRALLAQCARLAGKGLEYEIIVGDDASSPGRGTESVGRVCGENNCRLVRAETNRGRAANRNNLAREARGSHLLFIDCDALLTRGDFIARYWEEANGDADVVVGGVEAVGNQPSPDVSLRFRYEQSVAGIRSLEYREANPYSHFSTFNFMIRRDVFMGIMLDERCREYGYEDTILGLRLKQRGHSVRHIDNPLVHNGLDTNRELLEKTEASLRNLHRSGRDVQGFSHVGAVALRLDRLGLRRAMAAWHRMFGRMERANLLGANPSLLVFRIYKLGYLCSL